MAPVVEPSSASPYTYLGIGGSGWAPSRPERRKDRNVRIRFIRNATLVVEMGGRSILVDPMLGPAGAMDPVPDAVPNPAAERRIPLVDPPFDREELERLAGGVEAVLVTHTHPDHWDESARQVLPKDLPVLCQPEDVAVIGEAGFSEVTAVDPRTAWRGVEVMRTGGRHGLGEVGRMMGPVSGFVLRAEDEPTLYVAGDTVWCAEVEDALGAHQPDVTVVNAGAASFRTGGPITMTAEDVERVCQASPTTRVVAVHMEALNHCPLTRTELARRLREAGLLGRVEIPADGAIVELGRY